jgi:pyruvate dehydrogenase E2 component (dihydrolipoamide acetyltransferase)
VSATSEQVQVRVPDIGDFSEVPIIEILVAVGETVAAEDPLVTLESDKATMDVPSPLAGTVRELLVAVGDRVSQGSPLLVIEPASAEAGETDGLAGAPGPAVARGAGTEGPDADSDGSPPPPEPARAADNEQAAALTADGPGTPPPGSRIEASPGTGEAPGGAPAATPSSAQVRPSDPVYASPSVRRLARELVVDLRSLRGSGRKGRITAEDVRGAAQAGGTARTVGGPQDEDSGLGLAPWPVVDFERFGPVERVERSRIQRISGPALARNWVRIPHVTHNDEADITELEEFRVRLNAESARSTAGGGEQRPKLTMVSFLIAACVVTLREFPTFNAALDGEELVLRRYYNIGFAADTPAGLVVPVIHDADRKGLLQIAGELAALSGLARAGKLTPAQMSGGTFTISSLGGIGGTSFTPIINAPEVAILGVTRSRMKPVWDERSGSFAPRLMLPLSLSYDHRVIDGAAAARFVAHLAEVLGDLRRALL